MCLKTVRDTGPTLIQYSFLGYLLNLDDVT